MNGKILLEVNGLAKSYGDVRALKELSLQIEEGEIFALMGPNGAGKSTSLECILGTRTMDGGSVKILGMDPVKDRLSVFQQVGVQFQDASWQTGIRLGELCESMACLYDPLPDWRPMVKRFDLEKRMNTPVESLSGGERQKLSILIACIHRPRLIFLDELTTGLDPLARRETWDMIKTMQEAGTSVLLTSHFMDEVEFLCSRGIILNNGRVLAHGTIEELIQQGGGQSLDESYVNLLRPAEQSSDKNDSMVQGA